MKISSLQENLKNGLNIVSHIAGKNVNLPILNNVLLEARGGNIKLITTDLEIGIVTNIRGKIEKEDSFTVEAKIITDYVSFLPNKKVDLEVEKDNLKINCDNYKTNIKGMSAEEFPLIPNIDKSNGYTVNLEEFKKALSQIIFAVSNSSTRIELTGVLFNFTDSHLIMASTDSYRLAEKKIKLKTDLKEEKQIIIPAKTLQELIRIITGFKSENIENNQELNFYISDIQILFVVGNTELVSRLIEGQYPDYKQIIPQNHKTTAVVDKQEFIRAVKAASLFSKSGINDVNLDFPINKNKLVVTAASGQTGENVTELDADIKGSDNGIVVNYRYLLDGINNIDSEKIGIRVIDGNTPCVVYSPNDDTYSYIIMPIKQ